MFFVLKDDKDKSSLEKLYLQHRNRLFWTAFGILNDNALAEDAVQNTFIRVMEQYHRIENRNEYEKSAFLHIVCKNIAIDMYRKNARVFDKELPVEDIEEHELKTDENPLDIYISQKTIRTMIDNVKNLNDKYRDVFFLKYVNELENDEISQVLNISQPNVRKRLERGRAMLSNMFKEVIC